MFSPRKKITPRFNLIQANRGVATTGFNLEIPARLQGLINVCKFGRCRGT